MGSEHKRYNVVISDEATQMLIAHARFLAQVYYDSCRPSRYRNKDQSK